MPHGWWAVGTAGNVLIWSFVGWESVAQLTGEFQNPRTQLPRAIGVAFATIAILYSGLAVASVGVGPARPSSVPLAALMSAGLGSVGRRATAVLAVALAMATMNVYLASASRLAGALARSGGLPAWLLGDPDASVPRRPLLVIGGVGLVLLLSLTLRMTNTAILVRATSACFVAVYVAATGSAVRILRGRLRLVSLPTALLVTLLGVFSSWYLIVPALSGVCFTVISRHAQRATGDRRGLPARL
jgi:amino acid efflux transporter